MKTVLLLSIFFCYSFCYGQNSLPGQAPNDSLNIWLSDTANFFIGDPPGSGLGAYLLYGDTISTGTLFFLDEIPDSIPTTGYTLSIQDDSTVFYYNSGDSNMIVTDSLRTIKWLIKQVIDYLKIEFVEIQQQQQPDNNIEGDKIKKL